MKNVISAVQRECWFADGSAGYFSARRLHQLMVLTITLIVLFFVASASAQDQAAGEDSATMKEQAKLAWTL